MPWSLRFPFDTVDARIAARELLSVLRRDSAVWDVRLRHEAPNLFVEVIFGEGYDEQPVDPYLPERFEPFLVREREAPTPWPYDPVPDEDEEGFPRERPDPMRAHFDLLYGPRRDGPNENGDRFPPDVRQQIISEYLGSAQGRSRLAASMVAPLRQIRDYQSVARRTFLVEQMPEGALPIYDRDHPEPDAVGTRFDPADFVLPKWVQPGAFARFKGTHVTLDDARLDGRSEVGRIVEIQQVLRPEDPPGRDGPTYIKVQTWRVAPPEGNDVINAAFFARLWEPVERPADPVPYWERLLGDDLF